MWSLAYALELSSVSLATKLFWLRVEYLGVVTIPVAWLAFVLQYLGHQSWTGWRSTAGLSLVPIVTLLLVWTDGHHHLFHTEHSLDLSGTLPVLRLTYGPGYWLNVVYAYALLLVATFLIVHAIARPTRPGLFRRQTIAVLVGATMPWLANALHVTGVSSAIDLTPFAFALTGLAAFWGSFPTGCWIFCRPHATPSWRT